MGRQQAFCCICGGPFKANSFKRDWTFDVYLLTPGHMDSGSNKMVPSIYNPDVKGDSILLMQIPAEFDDDSDFDIIESSEWHPACQRAVKRCQRAVPGLHRVVAFFPDPDDHPKGSRYHAPLLLPVHQACMQMADDYIAHQASNPPAKPGSIVNHASLWQVLSKRFINTCKSGAICHPRTNLPEPHDYYVGKRCRNIEWDADEDPAAAMICEANPCPGTQITKIPVTPPSGTHITKMPMTPWSGTQITKTPTTPWSGSLVTKMPATPPSETHISTMATIDIGSSDSKGHASLRLQIQNRDRIWRILENACIGDIPSQKNMRPDLYTRLGIDPSKRSRLTLQDVVNTGPPGGWDWRNSSANAFG